MDTVTINVAGQTFKASKALLKKHSGYFDQRFSEVRGEKSVDVPGIPAEAFTVLLSYISKSELNILDKSLQLLAAVQDAASVLGLNAFSQDLERTLKASWSKMTDMNTVFNLAARLGLHSAMIRTVVNDVLNLFLCDKEQVGLRQSDLTYEMFIFATRLETFWENLYCRCKYFCVYESFFETTVAWIVKNNTSEANVDSLMNSLRTQTVSFKFLTDCVSNATGVPEMKEQLKFALQKKQEEIVKDLNDNTKLLSVSWFDVEQGEVRHHVYNGSMFCWDEPLKFKRSPLDTTLCAASDSHVYALGDQTLTSVRVQGGAPVLKKYPERLEINYCYAHSSSLFCFGWNRRDQLLYEFNSESRKFIRHGKIPVDSNFAATACGNDLYLLGETLHSSVKSNQLDVFKYNLNERRFSWVAILKKVWCEPELTFDSEVKEVASRYRSHLVMVGHKMQVFVQEFSTSNLSSDLYSYVFELNSPNRDEIRPSKLVLPKLFDKQTVLIGLQNNSQGIGMLFRSPLRGEYSLALLDHWNGQIKLLGFLPHFTNVHGMTGECVVMHRTDDVIHKMENISKMEAVSEATLVSDANDLQTVPVKYRSPRKEDLVDHQRSSDIQRDGSLDRNSDDFVRSPSRCSSLSSSYSLSSKASRRSTKKGNKRSIASRAVSVMTSLVR